MAVRNPDSMDPPTAQLLHPRLGEHLRRGAESLGEPEAGKSAARLGLLEMVA